MAHGRGTPEETLDLMLRRAHEPFASTVAEVGFPTAVRICVRTARRIIEREPDAGGVIAIAGIRDEGTVWLVGEDAEQQRREVDAKRSLSRDERVALIAARIFAAIAYRHPFFDANKRTGFLAAVLVGRSLGLLVRPTPFEGLEEDVIAMTSREAPDDEVARWLLTEIFIRPEEEALK
jgi:prophage maintenance system killer protein